MSRYPYRWFCVLLLSLMHLCQFSFAAEPDEIPDCTPASSYVVGFFNGVWNSERETRLSTEALKNVFNLDILPDLDLVPMAVEYEYFYNHTGSVQGASRFQDIAEVFIQRAEASGVQGRFEFMWGSLVGDASLLRHVQAVYGSSRQDIMDRIEDLYAAMSVSLAGDLSRMASRPPTLADYAMHETRLTTLALEGRQILMVSHSQGHFFARHAYDALALKADDSGYRMGSFDVLHVAPPATNLIGGYVLADRDLVIKSMKAFGVNSVPEANANLPLSHLKIDITGHEFVNTYLRDGFAPYRLFQTNAAAALRRLAPNPAFARQGTFSVTLVWEGEGDVDLHVIEPDGTHVSYKKPQGHSGALDMDNRIALGPEHYYASCQVQDIQEGLYQIAVNNFKADAGQNAVVQLASPYSSSVWSYNLRLADARGEVTVDQLHSLAGFNLTREPFGIRVNKD